MKRVIFIFLFIFFSCNETQVKRNSEKQDVEIELETSKQEIMKLDEIKKMDQLDLAQLIVLNAMMREVSQEQVFSLDHFYRIDCFNSQCSVTKRRN